MKPLMFGSRGASVVIQTEIDGQTGPELVIDQYNTLTLLMFVCAAIKASDDTEVIEAAACSAKAQLGGRWFK